jgi:thioredoxin-dependent peroxiredoxin
MTRLAPFALLVALACSHKDAEPPPPAPAAPLAAGNRAPDFTARASDGTEVKLSALRGKPVVLYFYPKDDTPGCTAEAQAFQAGADDFAAAGAEIIGVSFDDDHSHRAFASKHGLTFRLVSDKDGRIAAKYGVPTRLGMARRTTFVIDRDGKITKTFADVEVDGHDDEVLAAVKSGG